MQFEFSASKPWIIILYVGKATLFLLNSHLHKICLHN